MSLVLVLSIAIRLLAMVWSIVLLRRLHDWRMGFLTLMLALMALRQILTLAKQTDGWTLTFALATTELPGLAVSILAFLAVLSLERIINTQRERERDVEKAEQRTLSFGQIFEGSVNEIYIFDAHSLRFTQVNEAARQNLGYSMEELRALTPLNLKPEHTPESFEQLIAPLRNGNHDKIEFTTVHRRKDGSLYPVEVHLQHMQFESTPVFVAIILDITARKQTEDALQEEHERSEAILRTAVDGIMTIDDKGMIETLNKAAEEIFGYSASEVIGHNVKMLMPSPYHEEHDDYLRRYLATGEKKIIGIGREVAGRRKDGTTFPLDLAVGELQLVDRRLFTGIVRDITDHKQAEEEAKKRLNELAHASRVASMGEMASGLAHEINQPLTAIGSYAEACSMMLRTEAADTNVLRDSLQEIAGQAQRAGDIVTRLRQFVKRAEVDRSQVNINSLVCDALELSKHDLSNQRIDVCLELDDQLPEVPIDKTQIEQVVVNLVRNAIDAMEFMEADNRKLTVRTGKANTEQPVVEVAISDTGAGLAPETADQLFNAFFTTKPDGMGLGLAISQRIVEAHRGRLWPTPNGNAGTTFRFTLPISDVDSDGT